MELEGKVALVTGASGGIGAAVARKLHDAGASIGLLSRRGDDLGLERGLGLECDVRDRAAVADGVRRAWWDAAGGPRPAPERRDVGPAAERPSCRRSAIPRPGAA